MPMLMRLLAVGALLIAGSVSARAQDGTSSLLGWRWADMTALCPAAPTGHGVCTATVYGGKFNNSQMTVADGLNGLKAPWDWTYADSYLLAATFNRDIGQFGNFLRFEAEFGAAKRFGLATAGEFWSALYIRWIAFPWNRWVRTSMGISTGLSWATHVDDFERLQSSTGRGSRLLHFMAPEITLGLPQWPDIDLVLRWHHRSGGAIIGDMPIFNGTGDGVNYTTAGLRLRF